MRVLLIVSLIFSIAFSERETPLEEMIGQMLMVGFHGTSQKDEWVKTLRKQISSSQVGGVILYSYNIKDPMQLLELTTYLHYSTRGVPLWIAIDQEGGKVAKLTHKKDFSDYPSAKSLGKKSSSYTQSIYRNLACELKGYGIVLNFAPVVDLDFNGSASIGKLERSFSNDPDVVVSHSKAFIDAHRSCGVLTAIKHFPGHGFAADDTHEDFVDITDSFKEIELKPFEDLIHSGHAKMVMMSHLINKNIDNHPASLSKEYVDMLRGFGFGGVIVSDDMQMGAIREHYSFEESVVMAVQVGVDLIVFSNYFYQDPQIPEKFRDAILKAIDDGLITKEQIKDSYERIAKLKRGR